jgi:hypothetical protein
MSSDSKRVKSVSNKLKNKDYKQKYQLKASTYINKKRTASAVNGIHLAKYLLKK